MQISQTVSWPAATWPDAQTPASQYAIFQVYPVPAQPAVPLQTVTTTSTILAYDDTASLVFQVRPTNGTAYGPECAVVVINDVPCRAWLRKKVRVAISDQANQTGVTVNWPDEEINTYIGEAMGEVSILFPRESDTTIPLLGPITDDVTMGSRSYPLPTDCYMVKSVAYNTQDGHMRLYLKEKPFRGGETTATTFIGYPKLGIYLAPLSGRFYPGHYDQYEQQITIDWDPAGDGDYLTIRYAARYSAPTSDAQVLTLQPEDMELISLRTQMKCWLRIEGQDTRLSRWRGKEDGGRRDDMPTQKMSFTIKQLYDQVVNDRREMRIKVRRLVRR